MRMRLLSVLVLVGLFVGYSSRGVNAAPVTSAYAPEELLVQYHPNSSNAQQQRLRGLVNGVRKEVIRGASPSAGVLELVGLPERASVQAAVATLQADPAVAFAEPNWLYTTGPVTARTPNDPELDVGHMWGMYGDADPNLNTNFHLGGNRFGSQANEAWAAGWRGSTSVVIGVIDEGIEWEHSDLAANIWVNPGESGDKAFNNSDDDGNGYIDDVRGWDFHNNDNSVYDGTGDNHGTHVAGTIGAAGNNSVDGNNRVVGVNWNITMVPAKFLGPNGGYLSNAVKALDYLVKLKSRYGVNVVATNNSWGGGGYSQALHDAIIRAAKAEILFVAAAGNDNANNDSRAHYPSNYNTLQGTTTESAASYDAVIAVAAIDEFGDRASFSNYGRKTVDLGAPGVSIISTVPTNAYAYYSGTSMAAPHVSGAAALYAVKVPTATASTIRSALLNNTLATTSLNRKTVTNGRLDISCALNTMVQSSTGLSTATCKK